MGLFLRCVFLTIEELLKYTLRCIIMAVYHHHSLLGQKGSTKSKKKIQNTSTQ